MKRFEKLFWFGKVFDNESGEGGTDEGGASEGGDGSGSNDQDVFTKEEVQRMLEKNRAQNLDRIKQLQEQLNKVTTNTKKSEEERQALLKQLESVRRESMTKEELAREEQQKQAEQYQQQLTQAQRDAEVWQTRFKDQTINTAILTVAGPEAYNPNQFLQLVKPAAELVEVVGEDGTPTGQFEVKIKMDGLTLSVEDAVKRMKEKPEQFGNLFKSGVKGGIGHLGGQSQGFSLDNLKNASPDAWAEQRKQLGLR